MSNIVSLNVPPRRQRLSERVAVLVDTFARHRRVQDDVFWLKENAELLGILESTGQKVAPEALEPLTEFLDGIEARLDFFPQYYRFLLSIGLDLEDLGLPGDRMGRLCHKVSAAGLPEAELSDLQRAEARRLLARRGIETQAADPGLDDRLRAFARRSATFALPNKKAAYELTHIVFYLSEYGRRDPQLDAGALRSLEYVGILAYLEQNMDLLAEVCVALRQGRCRPPALWEETVRAHLSAFDVIQADDATLSDQYHDYLVSTWAVLSMGHDDSGAAVPPGRTLFVSRTEPVGALRQVSCALMDMADCRVADWGVMRDRIYASLPTEACAVLARAEASTDRFEAFFEVFARAPATAP